MTRRANDWYPTETWATQELLRRVQLVGDVLEPCVGDGAIATYLAREGFAVRTNDLDRRWPAESHADATDHAYWRALSSSPAWVVTNPPFSVAHKIVPLAWHAARRGVAMLLRLTYLEPCEGRGGWLAAHPPNRLIVLPRMSFTGDGATDSVTCAWMVWAKWLPACEPAIQVVDPADERQRSLLEASR